MSSTERKSLFRPLSPVQVREEARRRAHQQAGVKPLSELIGAPILALIFAVPMALMGQLLLLPALGIGLMGVVWLVIALVWYSTRAPGTVAISKLEEEFEGALKGRCPHCRKEVVVRAALPDQPSGCPACGKPV